jgi:protein-S-isoprenylcysteine O-methyltransferase Ste14
MVLLLGLWALYFCLHSVLASLRPKQWFQKNFPHWPLRYYRISYNLLFLLGLGALVWFQYKLPSSVLYHQTGATYALGLLFITIGLVIMVFAGLHYDLKSFSGMTDEKADALRTNKLNRFVRHPLYSGTSLFFIGVCIVWPYYKNLCLLILYFIYLTIGMYLEEKKLVSLFGQEYMSYQKKTKKLVPYVW